MHVWNLTRENSEILLLLFQVLKLLVYVPITYFRKLALFVT